MRSVTIKLATAITVATTIFMGGAQYAKASSLYELGSFSDNSTDTPATPPLWVGFTFQIAPGFQATYDKVAVWVKDTAVPKVRNTVYLYELGNDQTAAGTQLFAQDLVLNSTTPSTVCTISDGSDRNDYCIGTALSQVTLTSGKTYALMARYAPLAGLNDNLAFALGLSSLPLSPEISTASNVIFGGPRYSNNNVLFTNEAAGIFSYFGPNLGGFQVTAVPGPSAAVPAPLPLLGACMALTYSRKIRKRITTSV